MNLVVKPFIAIVIGISMYKITQFFLHTRYGQNGAIFGARLTSLQVLAVFLQTLLYGYGGFRLKNSGLAFNPSLPPNVTKMTISLNYLGNLMDFAVTEKEIKINLFFSGPISPSLEISTREGVFKLERGSPVTISNTEGAVRVRNFKGQISSHACDHTPLHICILFLVSFC